MQALCTHLAASLLSCSPAPQDLFGQQFAQLGQQPSYYQHTSAAPVSGGEVIAPEDFLSSEPAELEGEPVAAAEPEKAQEEAPPAPVQAEPALAAEGMRGPRQGLTTAERQI